MNEHSHDNPDPTATLVSAGECEFYLTVYDMPYYIFYYYTTEILYAMVKEFDNSRLQYFKAKLYNLPFRPKIQFNFGENFLDFTFRSFSSSSFFSFLSIGWPTQASSR